MDRLIRRLADLESVIERVRSGPGCMGVTLAGDLDLGTPTGKMLGRILASVAQHEVELKGGSVR